MPENTDEPRDYGDALHDADRGDAVRTILEALKEGWLEPKPVSTSAMADYGSSAGLVWDRLHEKGFKVVRTDA